MATIKTLPIVERWDCNSCGNCCRGSIIPLSADDRARLAKQNWDQHPDFQDVRTELKMGMFGGHYRLNQRADGSCVFLMDDNRCQIHAEHGADAKPIVCQMYPLQFVPHQNKTMLTLRRSCPSAAGEDGRELEQHKDAAVRLAKKGKLLDQVVKAPKVTTSFAGSWEDVTPVTSLLDDLLSDERYPLVRRIVHGIRACAVLDRSKYGQIDKESKAKLLRAIHDGVADDTTDVFQQREQPDGATRALFRQCAAEYLRLHSTYRATNSWGERWRLTRAAVAFARGQGKTPDLHRDLPVVEFAKLEDPIGHFGAEVQQPFLRYYEANAKSLQYIIASRPTWPITRSFRALALGYPIALWLLRWMAHNREVTLADAIELVTILDRGQGYESLIGKQHMRRLGLMSRDGGLERLVAWYAR